jgi:hypothetical protein
MLVIKKKKVKVAKKPVKRSVSVKVSQPKSLKSPSKKTKNTAAYFECLNACCQKGIKPKNISQVAHECKTNALAVSKRMSAQKASAVKKIKQGYAQLGKGLNEFIKSK